VRTLIVDDEPLAVERMQILCSHIPALNVVGTASDGAAALRLIAALTPDLVLLDMTMPELDGLGVARVLAGQANRPAVVFVTAHDDFAVEAFDCDAVDYVLKPVARERLERAVERDYVRLHVGQRSYLMLHTIAGIEARLDPERFIRLHRSTIVRRDRIAGLKHDGLGVWSAELADGSMQRIGRTYLARVKAMAGR